MNTTTHPTKIKVIQYMYGDFEYYPWSKKINRHYCERHGYEYGVSHQAPRVERYASWQKIPTILSELQNCDYLLLMDADAHFYSHELTVEQELIPLMAGKPILMAQDFGSEQERWTPGKPNAGVILMKTDDQVRAFCEEWDKSPETDPSVCWNWPVDQLGLWNVVMPKFPDMVQVHPEYYMIQGRYGQYIRHYMLLSDKERTEQMRAFCERRNIE